MLTYQKLPLQRPNLTNNLDHKQETTTMAAEPKKVTEKEFLYLGLKAASNGRSDRWKRKQYASQVTDFCSNYTVHPRALAKIWHALRTTPFANDRIDGSVKPEHILVVYRWLTKYESEAELNSHSGYGAVAIRSWCKNLTQCIAWLRKVYVSSLICKC